MAKTYLEVVGVYGKTGWGDPDTGMEYFNDRVVTEHGQLGKLKTEDEDDFPIIVQADEVVLIRRGFPFAWDSSITGIELDDNPFGFQVLTLVGKNGMVRYRLFEDELAWKNPPEDDPAFNPEKLAKFQIGVRTYSKWTPVVETPARTRNNTTTTVLQEAT